MALQTNLNKKDKITIAVLLFAAVIFMIAWFLIKPTITTIMTTDEKIEQAEAKQQLNKNKIMLLTSGEAIYNKAVDDLNESTAEYYDIMDSSEIDRMVTSYVLKSGLFAENLTINMPTDAVDESPYIYSTVSTGTNKNTTSDTTTESNNKADSLTVPYNSAKSKCKSTQSSGVKCVSLRLVVTGSQSVCQAFLDDICTKPAVRITGFDWSKVEMIDVYNEETGRYEQKDPGTVRLTVSFNLYMAEVADYSTAVSNSAT